jgi:hypothetical protein
MSQNPNSTKDLNQDEQKAANGGSLLGGDDSMIKGVTQGYVNVSNTDDDGDTSSTNIDFGSGSLLQNESE